LFLLSDDFFLLSDDVYVSASSVRQAVCGIYGNNGAVTGKAISR
jgi:hypothetical protein